MLFCAFDSLLYVLVNRVGSLLLLSLAFNAVEGDLVREPLSSPSRSLGASPSSEDLD